MAGIEENIASLKRQMREAQIKRRAALSPAKRLESSRNITANFIANIPVEQRDIIASYSPLPNEIDIKLLNEILGDSNVLALPCIDGKDKPLIFRRYNNSVALHQNGEFKIYEPDSSSPEVTPHILIIPLLAFDRRGYRLGFGGGFYDRTIESLKNVPNLMTVGIAYDFQEVSLVPHSKHDQKIDCVITDKGVVIAASN